MHHLNGSSACPEHEAVPRGTRPIHLCIHSPAWSRALPSLCPLSSQ
uniref:Uncharacterized protein n=1 Tax=Anguilla anguilla TaxID=7936 RepID=A0A0E9PLA9_ANGAN